MLLGTTTYNLESYAKTVLPTHKQLAIIPTLKIVKLEIKFKKKSETHYTQRHTKCFCLLKNYDKNERSHF